MANYESFSEDLVPRITPQPAFVPTLVFDFVDIYAFCLFIIHLFCFVEYFQADCARSVNNIGWEKFGYGTAEKL